MLSEKQNKLWLDTMKNSNCGIILLGISVLLLQLNSANGQDPCFQKADPGHCRASIPRFFFDTRSGRCDTFLYGGCGGNRNNFYSFDECNSFKGYCLKKRGF